MKTTVVCLAAILAFGASARAQETSLIEKIQRMVEERKQLALKSKGQMAELLKQSKPEIQKQISELEFQVNKLPPTTKEIAFAEATEQWKKAVIKQDLIGQEKWGRAMNEISLMRDSPSPERRKLRADIDRLKDALNVLDGKISAARTGEIRESLLDDPRKVFSQFAQTNYTFKGDRGDQAWEVACSYLAPNDYTVTIKGESKIYRNGFTMAFPYSTSKAMTEALNRYNELSKKSKAEMRKLQEQIVADGRELKRTDFAPKIVSGDRVTEFTLNLQDIGESELFIGLLIARDRGSVTLLHEDARSILTILDKDGLSSLVAGAELKLRKHFEQALGEEIK